MSAAPVASILLLTEDKAEGSRQALTRLLQRMLRQIDPHTQTPPTHSYTPPPSNPRPTAPSAR